MPEDKLKPYIVGFRGDHSSVAVYWGNHPHQARARFVEQLDAAGYSRSGIYMRLRARRAFRFDGIDREAFGLPQGTPVHRLDAILKAEALKAGGND